MCALCSESSRWTVGPFTTEPFSGERIESVAVLLGLDPDDGVGESGVVPPEPHPAASRANAISADPITRALRSLTASSSRRSPLESLLEPSREFRTALRGRVEPEAPRPRSEVEVGDEMPRTE